MNAAMEALQQLVDRGGLLVVTISWNDPVLILSGSGWRLRLMTAWRVLFEGKYLLSSDDKIDEHQLRSIFSGNQIVACSSQSRFSGFDPACEFKSGHVLEVFSTSPIEPWIIFSEREGAVVPSPSN